MKQEEKEQINETYNDYVESVTPKANLWLLHGKSFFGRRTDLPFGAVHHQHRKKIWLGRSDGGKLLQSDPCIPKCPFDRHGDLPGHCQFWRCGSIGSHHGFANSVAATAHGFKVEGHVFGVGARIFQIAGPVILVWDFFVLDPWFDLLVYDDTWYVIEKIP